MKTIPPISATFLLVILLCTSCYTYVNFEKTVPPDIKPRMPKNSIALVNAFDYNLADRTAKSENKIYQTAVPEVISGLNYYFTNDEYFDFHLLDTLSEGIALSKFADTLRPDSVINTCRMNNSSLLLIIDAFNIYIDSEVEVEESEDGDVTRTSNYYLIVTAGLSLYSNTGDLIDRSWTGRSTLYKSRGALAGIAIFTPALDKAGEDIKYLASLIGEDYLRKFYPGTETVTRKIYANPGLQGADKYCADKDWEKAIEILIPLTGSPDPKIADKAAKNLAVAYEAIGNDKAARYWSEKSAPPGN